MRQYTVQYSTCRALEKNCQKSSTSNFKLHKKLQGIKFHVEKHVLKMLELLIHQNIRNNSSQLQRDITFVQKIQTEKHY